MVSCTAMLGALGSAMPPMTECSWRFTMLVEQRLLLSDFN
jgi:hypothetical protein